MKEIDIYRAMFQFIYDCDIPDTVEGANYLRGVIDITGELAERVRNEEKAKTSYGGRTESADED